MTMTNEQLQAWAERIVAAKDDPVALEALTVEAKELGHTDDDVAAYLNIVQEIENRDATQPEPKEEIAYEEIKSFGTQASADIYPSGE